MEEAQEKDMDSVTSFKVGELLQITGIQNHVGEQNQMISLLASSNRYGYVFYATETDGLALIPSTYIDQESRHLLKTSDDDDNDPNKPNEKSSIIYRSYIPGQLSNNRNLSIIPYWLALNADETILALILRQTDTNSWLIILYDVVKLIQMPDSTPLCPPIRLPSDDIGHTIQYFTWNPAIPTRFAFLDGRGSVLIYEIDQISKQMKTIGRSNPNDDNSSICWSPQGKQLIVVKFDATLESYESNMTFKKTYPSATNDPTLPPCISVLWLSTRQFLLGFSENNPDENTFFQILVTYDKDQPPRTLIYHDLFFDASDASSDINPQYFYVRLPESKILITGLSKSLKINLLGPNELHQDSLDVWALDDQSRAIVEGSKDANQQRPILTGMALGLNSTLSITDGNRKLPPCPILLLSNNEGVLQVYYFIHKDSPTPCRAPEAIKPSQTPSLTNRTFSTSSSSEAPPSNLRSLVTSTNGFQFPTAPTTTTTTSTFSSNQPAPRSVIDDISTAISATGFDRSTSVPQTPTQTMTTTKPSISNNKNLLAMVDQFQSRLESISKPLSTPLEPLENLNQSLENQLTQLRNMTTSFQTSMKSIKSLTNEHIEFMTKIENARHQIKLCQKENLYHLLQDRELDPWTQSRLDSIEKKYDQLKHSLNVLLQLTHATIHDKSLSTNDEEAENEDFLPDLDISLNTTETMKQRIQKRLLELSHKVSETEKDLESLCAKFNTDLLSSSTFTKTTMSSSPPPRVFHPFDAQILSHLQATHPKVLQIHMPPAVVLHLSSSNEPKKQSTIESIKLVPSPSVQPSTPKSTNSPTVESEGFKNMLRLVRTSIDIFSGATSPEQLQELSSTIATSPISTTPKSTATSITKTPTVSKTTNLPKTTTITKSLQTTIATTNIQQTPARLITTTVPTISVTPDTPTAQATSSNTSFQPQPNRPMAYTGTDLIRTQSASGDNAIRSLLNNSTSSSTPITTIPGQPPANTTPIQVAPKTTIFGNLPSTSAAQVISQSSPMPTTAVGGSPVISTPSSSQSAFGVPVSPASTVVTSVQPIMSTGFGSKPIISGATALNLTSNNLFGLAFGGAATSTASPFGSGFNTATSPSTATATSSAPSAGTFGSSATSIPSPFGSGCSTPLVTTTSAPTANIFASSTSSSASPFVIGFGNAPSTTTTTSAPAPSAGIFGNNFGGSFNPATTTSSASSFGAPPSLSSGSTFGGFGASPFGFNAAAPPATSTATSTAGTSIFGANASGTPSFGSGFPGFNTQSSSTGQPSSFSFGGFGSQRSESTATPSVFGGFGSPPAPTQPPAPFGTPLFGAASPQSPGFGTATSSFGASSTQSTSSPSFTTYRK